MPSSLPSARLPSARRCRLLAVPLVALALIVAGCSSGGGSVVTIVDDSGSSSRLRGTALAQPIDKPALNLIDTAGAPFDLRSRTAGKVTLLFFGYTHCPDVCPTTMADIAAALDTVPASVRSQIATVFVSTDPERDTGDVLNRWLNQFDSSFIGVRGTLAQVRAQADALGIPMEDPVRQPSGIFTVTHGTQVMAFTLDDKARVVYLAGTQVADYAHDLPILVNTGKTT
ncbi:SCO family protein [Protofrankia symbiont of Coriaria ruscifolia]|uniref:SCO family protein n=1 Tax=Protofrankia symbiont of Coriaria ruscifolia TaxID=1306542 RepID=UPI001040E9BF|nr:SCO family protein [Protofrankia symbiont of Coriaria ruscifolia]